MKKLFILFLAIITSMGTLFASNTQVDGIWYDFDSSTKTASVTFRGPYYYYYSNEYTGSVVIPSSVEYNSVTYSVTSIGENAFYNCSGLTSIMIPSSVSSIGDYAFDNCSSLTSIEIPNSVTSIGYVAFSGCSSLTSIEIPNSVTSIVDGAFTGCTSLTSIVVENGNSVYDSRNNCNAIIETASNCLIVGCQNTEIPSSVTTIGRSAFAKCYSLTSVTIPYGVTTIREYAFQYCIKLANLTMPNSITSIGDNAFESCTSLTSIEIPNSVTNIGDGAFGYCSGLTSIVVENGNSVYDSRNNCNAIIETASNVLIAGCQNTEIPNSVTGIGIWTFSGCSGLTSIEIPNSVTNIEIGAFYKCKGLTSIEIPNSVTSIGNDAFGVCSGLTSLTIGNSVTSIGNYAFSGCSGLTSITNHAITPQTIDSYVFSGVKKTTCTLYVPEESISLYQEADGWKEFANIQPFSCISSAGTCGAKGDNLTWELSCDSVLTISGSGAMEDWGSHSPWNEYRAAIAYLSLPEGISYIGKNAFSGCSRLKSVTIPNSVTNIGEYAFYQCSALTSIEIPISVKDIGNWAFEYCSSLTSVAIPNGITNIRDYVFYKCSALTNVEIPNSVTRIGRWAFSYCSSLTSVTIPNNVTSIDECAFASCYALTSIEIPNSVTEIGEKAFEYCGNLESITCTAITPPTCSSEVFNYVNKSIPLYVSKESIGSYKTANEWKDFTNILPIAETPTSIEEITNNQSPTTNKVIKDGQIFILRGRKTYNLQGQLVKE